MSFLVALFKPLAYLSLPFLVVRQIAVNPAPSPLRYYARLFVYVGTLVTVASCSVIAAAGLALVGRSGDVNHLVARIFYTVTSRVLDLKVEVDGEDILTTRPAVFMSNHQSMLDVFVIGKLIPRHSTIMAKKSLQFSPLGPFMSLAGAIFVDRGNNARAVRSVEAAGEKMKRERLSLWMFPEGTRTLFQSPDMLPLKKGGFHLAINAGIPIVPVVIENYWRMYRKGVFETGVIKVRVLPPVPTDSLTAADVHDLVDRVRDGMLVALRDIPVKADSEPKSSASPSSALTSEKKAPSSSTATPAAATKEDKPAEPLEQVASVVAPSLGVGSDPLETSALTSQSSSSSLASSSVSSRRKGSETGHETEEDEGMVLVGRPSGP